MQSLKTLVVIFVLSAGLSLFAASTSNAQVAYTYYPYPVRVYAEPHIYYHPYFQPIRSTYYYAPSYPSVYGYGTPYYTYRYPVTPYYYAPMGGRFFVTGVIPR